MGRMLSEEDDKIQEQRWRAVGLEDKLEELWVQLRQLVLEIQEQRHMIVELRYQVLEHEEAASDDQKKEVEEATTCYDQKVLLARERGASYDRKWKEVLVQEERISAAMVEVTGGQPVLPPSSLPSLPLKPREELMTKLDTYSSVSKAAPDSDFTLKAETHLAISPSSFLPSSPPMESSAHIETETHLVNIKAETHLGILPSSSLPSSAPMDYRAHQDALQAMLPAHGPPDTAPPLPSSTCCDHPHVEPPPPDALAHGGGAPPRPHSIAHCRLGTAAPLLRGEAGHGRLQLPLPHRLQHRHCLGSAQQDGCAQLPPRVHPASWPRGGLGCCAGRSR